MGNYFEGTLLMYLSKAKLPKELIKKYEDMEKDFASDRGFSVEISTNRLNDVEDDDFNSEEEKQEYIEFLNHAIVIDVRLSTNTKYYIDRDVERKLLECIKELKPYVATYEEFIKDFVLLGDFDSEVEVKKEFPEENYALGYLGTIKDEDHTYHKSFYLDEEVLRKEKEARAVICERCKKDMPDTLCDDYKFCFRAYTKGIESVYTQLVKERKQ